MAVPVGHKVTFFWMVRPLATAIDSGVIDGPTMAEAPLATRARAADSAACGSPCASAETAVILRGTPAAAADWLA
jgi:hypothetical protein